MRKPTVTIITTCYNHGEFISRCIESVRSQTFVNWEQIIVDDASTDNSFAIASDFAKSDTRIRVLRHRKNYGINRLADNYNQALKMAQGKYIAILESDDYWPKDKLSLQLKAFNDKKVVLSFGDCILVNMSGVPIKLFTYTNCLNLQNNNPVGSIIKLFYKLSFSIIPATVMIRKYVLLKIGGFRKDKYYPFVDIPTILKLSTYGQFRYVNEILGIYRKQKTSNWYEFASKTAAMGKDEIGACVTKFIESNQKNKFAKNFPEISNTKFEQSRYLRFKRKFKPISLLVNKIAFSGILSPMPVFFYVKYLIYNIKRYTKTLYNLIYQYI